jgi:hypothetical protein
VVAVAVADEEESNCPDEDRDERCDGQEANGGADATNLPAQETLRRSSS